MAKKTLSELSIAAQAACKDLNTAILEDKYSDILSKKEALTDAVKEYNSSAIIADFITLRSMEQPMKAAIEQLSIATIAAKENKNKDTDVSTYTIEPAVTQISLVDFNEFCQREKMDIANSKMWKHMVDKFCLLVSYRVAKSIGKDPKKLEETYYIKDIAKAIDMGATPMSNTALLKNLQSIVDAIIYADEGGKNLYKVTSHDVAYIVQTMTKRGKISGSIVCPRPQTMHTLVMDMLHRIVTDGEYTLEYLTKKQQKAEAVKTEDAAKTEDVKEGGNK